MGTSLLDNAHQQGSWVHYPEEIILLLLFCFLYTYKGRRTNASSQSREKSFPSACAIAQKAQGRDHVSYRDPTIL